MSITLGNKEFFPGIGKIKFEGGNQIIHLLINGTMKISWWLVKP